MGKQSDIEYKKDELLNYLLSQTYHPNSDFAVFAIRSLSYFYSPRVFERLIEIIEEKERNLKEIVKNVLRLSKKFEKESEASKIRSELLILKSKYENNKAEIERLRNLVEKLSQLEESINEEEMPASVKTILDLKIKGVYGTIASLMKVDKNYQLAIEVAAGSHLFDVVVENFDVAKYCIEYLKRERIGRATFLPLDKIKPKIVEERFLERDGVIGRASDLISYDKKFEKAFQFVFGNTLVIKSLEYAKNIGIGKVRMVTLDGDLVEKSGAITGGYLIRRTKSVLKKSWEKEIEEYLQAIKMLEQENAEIENKIRELEKNLRKIRIDESPEKLKIETLKIESEKEIEKLRKRRKKLIEERIRLQTKISNFKVRVAKIEAEIENLQVESEEFKIDESLLINKPLDRLRELISETLREIKMLGPINFKAVEEYEKIKEEFESLKKKFDKVVDEKEHILQMIDEIEKRRREVFYSTLKEVSFFFNQTFNQLTGGNAKLELEEPENLESGLLIQASYPGKPLVNIDSMSGGEKSLVAIAFLFALQKLRPTPFYVLDEIDAALDKENAEKIGKFLKEASKYSQIILITHNDITVKYANVLYGVTMINGESKIVALELPKT